MRRSAQGGDAALVEECVESREEEGGGERALRGGGQVSSPLRVTAFGDLVSLAALSGTLAFLDTTNDLLAQENKPCIRKCYAYMYVYLYTLIL